MCCIIALSIVLFAATDDRVAAPEPVIQPEAALRITRTVIASDPRLGEVTDFWITKSADDDADTEIYVLGSSGILVLRHVEGARFEVVRFDHIQKPPDVKRFYDNHGFRDLTGDGTPEILVLGTPGDPRVIAAYAIDGSLLWVLNPEFPIQTGWFDIIRHVQIMLNVETNERRVLLLSGGNPHGMIVSHDGRILSRFSGYSNGGGVEWTHTGTEWTGCVFGHRDKVVGVDGDGNIRFTTTLPNQEQYISGISPLRVEQGRPEAFMVTGTIRKRGLDQDFQVNDYVMRIGIEDGNAVPRFRRVDGYRLWHLHARIPITPPGSRTLYVQPRRFMVLGFWDDETGSKVHDEDLSNELHGGGGRFGISSGQGAVESFSVGHPNDSLLVGWGDRVWLLQIDQEP